jgi:SAM-dependent methyltransferase
VKASDGPLGATTWGQDPEFVGPRHHVRLALIARVLACYVSPGARVLDVGAGAGRLANLLAGRGYSVVGVEAASEFVSHANQQAVGGARFLQGDANALPIESASFEATLASEVLEHLDDDACAVGELWRVLVPGGVCVASVPADAHRWDASDDWAGHRRRYAPEDLKALFTRAGFEVVRVARWGFPFVTLYHRLVYLPMLARKRRGGDRPSAPAAGLKKLAIRLMSALFEFDRLLFGGPWGLGLIIVARKPTS